MFERKAASRVVSTECDKFSSKMDQCLVPTKETPCNDQIEAVDIKNWWHKITRRRPLTHSEWTNVLESLRTVQCHIVSARVPVRMTKSQYNSLEAEWRWTQESEGGSMSRTQDSVLTRRIATSSVLGEGSHSNRRSCHLEGQGAD